MKEKKTMATPNKSSWTILISAFRTRERRFVIQSQLPLRLNLYAVWNVLAKNWFFKLFGQNFQNKKIIKTKMKKQNKLQKAFPWYIFFRSRRYSFGKCLKFLPKHNFFFTLVKKRGPKHCFCHFLKNTVPSEFPLLKLYNFYIFKPY